jgi:hypothetical protein
MVTKLIPIYRFRTEIVVALEKLNWSEDIHIGIQAAMKKMNRY